MKTKKIILLFLAVAVLFVAGVSSVSAATVEYWLKAVAFDKPVPGAPVPGTIPMWGFAKCTDGTFAVCESATVPGPELTAVENDTLVLHVRNDLTGAMTEPVSLIIPGQLTAFSPVKFTDPQGRERVKSFTTETPADATTVVNYTWNAIKPGTYLYQSGTHPQIQVQMGLYGALKVASSTAGEAYPGVAYDSEVTLVFSEIDPVFHAAVADGSYGTTGPTSTIWYEPRYFLINGEPYSGASLPIPTGPAGSRVLLRILNAGLKDRVPVLDGHYLKVVAEDGNKYAYPKELLSPYLAAGKTMDAIAIFSRTGNIALFDRRLGLTNELTSPGGMLTYFTVSPVTGATLTASPMSPQIVGTLVTFTAEASGGSGSYEYKFWLKNPAGVWTMVRDYSVTNTWAWTPSQAGNYHVSVYARNAGSPAAYEAIKAIPFEINNLPVTSVSLTPDKESPYSLGTGAVTFTAAGSGGSGSYEYMFWRKDLSSGLWTIVRAYSSEPTWSWTPAQAGNFIISVYVRNAGSSAWVDTLKTISYTVQLNAPPVSSVLLEGDKTSPQTLSGVGTVTFTGTASGGSGSYEYKFWLKNPSGVWTMVQDYSTTSTWAWTPSQAGSYTVSVYARNAGSAATYEAFSTKVFNINP